MCGIAGILRFDDAPVAPSLIGGMLEKLAHRGRDHAAVESGFPGGGGGRLSARASIALGHRRLSIIDLSGTASQPMAYDGGNLWLVFNGEIYNYIELRNELRARGHHFETASDTEVILRLYEEYGPECIGRLNGMFALVLYDRQHEQVLLARDHFGVKPLYLHATPERLLFASANREARAWIRQDILENPAVYPPAGLIPRMEWMGDVGKAMRIYDRAWTELKMQ